MQNSNYSLLRTVHAYTQEIIRFSELPSENDIETLTAYRYYVTLILSYFFSTLHLKLNSFR